MRYERVAAQREEVQVVAVRGLAEELIEREETAVGAGATVLVVVCEAAVAEGDTGRRGGGRGGGRRGVVGAEGGGWWVVD